MLTIDLDYESGRAATRPEDEIETAVYRIAQEAMTNALKHSKAESIAVDVVEADGHVGVRVQDDGQGFDPSERAEGFGLLGMRERVELLGGRLEIDSAPGAGTTLTARLPTRRRPAVDGGDRVPASATDRISRSASSRQM
jgi:signal transduction histidine kinase